jgi:hypothetical protein
MAGYTKYKVVRGDSLVRIAQKNGLNPTQKWARKIWEDPQNSAMHTKAKMTSGRQVNRKIHMGNNKYLNYDHDLYKEKGDYRGYTHPDQIILYTGEEIMIPPKEKKEEKEEEKTEFICHIIKDEELVEGFTPDWQKKYELTFPVFDVKVKKSDIRSDDSNFYLFSTDDNERYKHTLSIDDNKSEDEKFVVLHFQCTPKNLKYTLEVQADEDKEGNEVENYYIFENKSY